MDTYGICVPSTVIVTSLYSLFLDIISIIIKNIIFIDVVMLCVVNWLGIGKWFQLKLAPYWASTLPGSHLEWAWSARRVEVILCSTRSPPARIGRRLQTTGNEKMGIHHSSLIPASKFAGENNIEMMIRIDSDKTWNLISHLKMC